MPLTFVTASVCLLRGHTVLTVRKRGTAAFMLPGGKIEPAEDALACAVREAAEETGLTLDPDDLARLGHWVAPAANEPGALVDSVVHVAACPDEPVPSGEIAELRWLDLDHPLPADLAPLLERDVVPALRRWVSASAR